MVSFFLRTSSQYDSLMQMGRWFGYRPGYEDLPRVWMTRDMRDAFKELATVEEPTRTTLLTYLREHRPVAEALVFLIRPREKPAQVMAVLDRLRQTRGEHLDRFPTLTAALCVVHDRQLSQRVNENTAQSEDVLRLFDGRLAGYKHPRDVVVVESLPRNAMGKVLKYALRERLDGGTQP